MDSRRIAMGTKEEGKIRAGKKIGKIHRSACQRMKRLGRMARVGREDLVHWVTRSKDSIFPNLASLAKANKARWLAKVATGKRPLRLWRGEGSAQVGQVSSMGFE